MEDFYRIHGRLMEDLWRICGGCMEDLEDLWRIYGGLGMPNTKLTLHKSL